MVTFGTQEYFRGAKGNGRKEKEVKISRPEKDVHSAKELFPL